MLRIQNVAAGNAICTTYDGMRKHSLKKKKKPSENLGFNLED